MALAEILRAVGSPATRRPAWNTISTKEDLMPEIDANQELWDAGWDWSEEGDEWSDWFGGTPALWHHVLLPRVEAFVPVETILEIAPGFGRWTQYLKDQCEHLVVVDLAERCIEHCQRRFADAGHIEYHVNDGRSLDMVADASLDFVFSFDSLVHAELDVIAAYLEQLARKMRPDGVGFFHHSNIGAFKGLTKLARNTPRSLRRRLVPRGILIDVHSWRAESVTAEAVAEACTRAGLACVAQEKITWEYGPYPMDALTVFTPRGSRWERERRVVTNRLFGREAKRMAGLYPAESFPSARAGRQAVAAE
jgi:SAM-dependent methyltransferase